MFKGWKIIIYNNNYYTKRTSWRTKLKYHSIRAVVRSSAFLDKQMITEQYVRLWRWYTISTCSISSSIKYMSTQRLMLMSPCWGEYIGGCSVQCMLVWSTGIQHLDTHISHYWQNAIHWSGVLIQQKHSRSSVHMVYWLSPNLLLQ